MVAGDGGEIIVGCGWLWVVGVKLWLVVGGRGDIEKFLFAKL